MLVLEKLGGFARDVAAHAQEVAAGGGSFRVFIGNTSRTRLVVVGEPHLLHATADLSFKRLEPGRAGLVRVEGQADMGAAMEFALGDESLLLGMHRPRMRGPSLVLEFAGIGGRRPSEFYGAMTHEFVGVEGSRHCIRGDQFAALVGHATEGVHSVLHVLLGPLEDVCRIPSAPRELTSRSCLAPGALAAGTVLEFAEWCRSQSPADFGKAIFILELSAVEAGLDRLDSACQAFALDVLIAGFVASGVLGLADGALDLELRAWHGRRQLGQGATLPKYEDYRGSKAEVSGADLSLHIEAALLLVKAAGLRCALALRSLSSSYRGEVGDGSLVGNSFAEDAAPRWAERRPSAALDTNCVVMAQHLLPTAGESEDEDPALSRDEVDAVMAAAQQCIHEAGDHALRRGHLFDSLERAQRDLAMRDGIRHYRTWVPPMRRRFGVADSKKEVVHESWGSEIFAGLDGGRDTDPGQILQSLGRGAPPYKSMSTNSKSGEFFFFSGDRRFLIKTVSETEAQLLFRMLPAYQAHIHGLPGSLIVRYAGLHRAHIPGIGLQYFSVMLSVFNPRLKVHETFDVKGSMLKRRRKADESIGKDEDWVEAGKRLDLPEDRLRELREAHEQDAAFLASFGVMDYSLLVGVHHVADGGSSLISALASASGQPPAPETLAGGLRATGGEDVFFVGLIDFLIAFSLYKKAEHLLLAARGHAEDASCVDPLSYAVRQVRFVQDRVLATMAPPPADPPRQRCKYGSACYRKNPEHFREFAHPQDADWDVGAREDRAAAGRLGTLRATVASARHLVNADFMPGDLSDPYVTVALGLQRARTHTVMDCLDPVWNCVLRLAVDEAHRGLLLDISVWDEDANRVLQGSDDFLGRLEVPLAKVMQEGPLDLNEKLQGIRQGELSLRLEFIPLEQSRTTT